MKSSIWSDPLKVGRFPQRDRQIFSTVSTNKIISNYQSKRDRSGELNQSGLKVILLRLENFHIYNQKKDARTSPFVFILSRENWMYFTEINVMFSSKYFDLDCAFVSNTGDTVKRGIPKRRSLPGSSLQQPQPRFQTKSTS